MTKAKEAKAPAKAAPRKPPPVRAGRQPAEGKKTSHTVRKDRMARTRARMAEQTKPGDGEAQEVGLQTIPGHEGLQPSAAYDRVMSRSGLQRLTVDDAVALKEDMQKFVSKVLIAETDYGEIPGTDGSRCLFKSGAEKLAWFFRLAPKFKILSSVENYGTDGAEPMFRYLVRCRVSRDGTFVAEGLAECNSWETKYRWRVSKLTCPNCGQSAVIKGRAEYGGGWLCWGNKGGCGQKWPDGATVIEGQQRGRIANEAIFDQVNTILKMACKRALIAAILIATGASQYFTQDLTGDEDDDDGPMDPEPARRGPVDSWPPNRGEGAAAQPAAPSELVVYAGTNEKLRMSDGLARAITEALHAWPPDDADEVVTGAMQFLFPEQLPKHASYAKLTQAAGGLLLQHLKKMAVEWQAAKRAVPGGDDDEGDGGDASEAFDDAVPPDDAAKEVEAAQAAARERVARKLAADECVVPVGGDPARKAFIVKGAKGALTGVRVAATEDGPSCSCGDFKKGRQRDAEFRCVHMLAVRYAMQTKTYGQPD